MRVSELANELGKTSKEILEIIKTKDKAAVLYAASNVTRIRRILCALLQILRGMQNLPHRSTGRRLLKQRPPEQKLQEQRHQGQKRLKQRLLRQRLSGARTARPRESRLRRS